MPRIPVTTKCRLQSEYKMQTENLKSFFVWYVITVILQLTEGHAIAFSAISLHDYLLYFGIFLAHFLMKIDCNIISSLHIVFSLCARVSFREIIFSVRPLKYANFYRECYPSCVTSVKNLFDLRHFCQNNPLFYHLNLIPCHY